MKERHVKEVSATEPKLDSERLAVRLLQTGMWWGFTRLCRGWCLATLPHITFLVFHTRSFQHFFSWQPKDNEGAPAAGRCELSISWLLQSWVEAAPYHALNITFSHTHHFSPPRDMQCTIELHAQLTWHSSSAILRNWHGRVSNMDIFGNRNPNRQH